MPDEEELPENLRSVLGHDKRHESIIDRNKDLTKTAIKAMLQNDKEKEKRIHEDQRKRDEEEMLGKLGNDAFNIVIKPKYQLDKRLKVDRECQQPSSKLYIGLGWDEDSQTNRKHYRKFYDDELENI